MLGSEECSKLKLRFGVELRFKLINLGTISPAHRWFEYRPVPAKPAKIPTGLSFVGLQQEVLILVESLDNKLCNSHYNSFLRKLRHDAKRTEK